jgi:hypothetical protein
MPAPKQPVSEKRATPEKQATPTRSAPEHGDEGRAAYEAGFWGVRDNAFPDAAFGASGPCPITDVKGNPLDVGEHIVSVPENVV